jgi:hypothetical protein
MARPRKPKENAERGSSEPPLQTRLENGFYKAVGPHVGLLEWVIIIVGGALFFSGYGFLFVSCAELTRYPK